MVTIMRKLKMTLTKVIAWESRMYTYNYYKNYFYFYFFSYFITVSSYMSFFILKYLYFKIVLFINFIHIFSQPVDGLFLHGQ